MLVLVAPSEGKAPPPAGAAPVHLPSLAHPSLNPARLQLVDALGRLAAGPPRRALAALGLSGGQLGEIDRNRDLLAAPAGPAAEVYTGVLYQSLGLATLGPAARRRAGERLLVASALWGVIALDDRIPAYRLGIGARLPRRPDLARWWRTALAEALPEPGLLVDLRSQAYARAWRPRGGTSVKVRAFVERDGRRAPVSHTAKAVRGDVARLLAQAARAPADPEGVAALVEAAGERVELRPPPRTGASWTLDVVRESATKPG